MKSVKSYVINPEKLDPEFINNCIAIAHKLEADLEIIVHQKEIHEPTISPIIGGGLPILQVEETQNLKTKLEDLIDGRKNTRYRLSQDIFADVFSNANQSEDTLFHIFSSYAADFILHNVYSDSALDSAFNHISPAIFIPSQFQVREPAGLKVFVFSEDMGTDLSSIQEISDLLNAKVKYIIQEPKGLSVTESPLEKITRLNHINLKDHEFSAQIVPQIDRNLFTETIENSESMWPVLQHSFLLKNWTDKILDIDLYEAITESKQPMIIV